MGRISTALIDGKLRFVTSYLGPPPSGTYRSTDPGPRLIEAVKSTPGATMGEHVHLGFAIHWGDEVDDKYECSLEITSANVAALFKSEFTWNDDALEAAREYVNPPEALGCIRALQQLVDRLAKLSAQGCATAVRQPAQWWQFWRT